MIDIICATNNDEVLKENLLDSVCIKRTDHPVILRAGFTNIPKAYNSVASTKPLKMYVHQDVKLSRQFFVNLKDALKVLPEDFGVIGVAGVKILNNQRRFYGWISDRGKPWGSPNDLPKEVDTLDELLLITHGDLEFDENLDLDFYGADVCMQAKAQGRKNYAINAYVEHNSSREFGGRTESFYRCQEYFKQKWMEFLPVATTCSLMEK